MSEKIIIEKTDCEELEKLHYEFNAYLNLEKTYLDSHMLDEDDNALNSNIYKSYHQKYTDSLKAYEQAKDKLSKKYNFVNQAWQLDFNTCEVTIG